MTNQLTLNPKLKNEIIVADTAAILLEHGFAGLFRHGLDDAIETAHTLRPEPVMISSLIEQGLSIAIERAIETRIQPKNYEHDNNSKFKYWYPKERVGRVILAGRRFYDCCSAPIPMLLMVDGYPQEILDTYHDYIAKMLDAYGTLHRRKVMDELLNFILPPSANILRLDELLYLYIKLVVYQER